MKTITLKKFKTQLEKSIGMKIDFRTHQFLENSNGGVPMTDYKTMKKIVDGVCNLVLELGNLELNADFQLEQLKTGVLKMFILDVIDRLNSQTLQ